MKNPKPVSRLNGRLDQPVLLFAVFCSVVMILDSTIISIYTLPWREPPSGVNYALFLGFLLFFLFSNFILLIYSRLVYQSVDEKAGGHLKFIYKLAIVGQTVLSAFLVIIAIQMVVVGHYEVALRNIAISISHISAVGYLSILVYQFIRWFISNKNYVVIAYAIGFSLIAVNIIISVIYIIDDSRYHDPAPRIRTIRNQIGDYSNYSSELLSLLITFYTYFSFISFICIWIPSVILLKIYAQRIGKIKYWILVAIPLVYFFLPFVIQQIGLYHTLLLEYGTQFHLLFYILFSPYKQIGGLLFGIVFWLTASKIRRPNLRALLRIAGIGMILLFGSTVLHGLTFIVAPPFGLVTVSFVGLASFLLLTGIYISASQLSRDINIRRELYKVTGEQFGLLGKISMAEVNRNLEEKVKNLLQKTEAFAKEQGSYISDLDESDYKKFVEEAIKEVKAFENKDKF
jgi:hypothetical protein